MCAATALALWLRRRLFGPLHAADVAIPLLILTPAQYGIFIHTPNLSHGAGPLVLLLAFCLAFTVRRRALRYPALVALDFLLIHSGFGIVAGALAPPLLAACARCATRAREGARAALLPAACAALSLLSIAIFAIGYDTRDLDQVAAARPPLAAYALYVALMFANVLGLKGAGAFAVLGGALAALAALAVAAEQLVRLLRIGARRRRAASRSSRSPRSRCCSRPRRRTGGSRSASRARRQPVMSRCSCRPCSGST